MDAGVVLRERRLKTRDGLFIHLQDGERRAGAKFSSAGLQRGNAGGGAGALLAWASAWREGENLRAVSPSVAFGVSCALAELNGELPQEADIARRRCAPAIRTSCSPGWRRCPAKSREGQSRAV
jgi:O-succinylbenzoate synthase